MLFTRTHLTKYLEAWRRAGLSPRVRDGLPLGDSLAVRHLHNLAKALVRPHDDLAWAALLRGWAGPQPLGLLAEIAGTVVNSGPKKSDGMPSLPVVRRRCTTFYQVLATAGKRVGREPLDAILIDCLSRFQGWEKLAAWEGPQGVANARAYLELLAAAAAPTPEATLMQTADLLSQAYQPPDPRAQDSPVEVLTVHAAKGLEFDHVFLPFLDWQPNKTGKKDAPFLMEEVPGTGTAVIALNRSYLQKEQSVLYQTLYKIGQKNALAEARRLFYVAVTRARKRLSHVRGGQSKTKPENGSFLPTALWAGCASIIRTENCMAAGTVNLWQEPPLPVRLFEADSELSSWSEALGPSSLSREEGEGDT